MKRIVLAMLLAGCAEKAIPDEDFSDLGSLDVKSDSFSKRMRFLGTLDPGQTRRVYYTSTPKFRGYTITGAGPVDLWVRSTKNDAVAWLLDSKFKIVAKNDDADDTTYDAHITATLAANKTYYLAMRDYDSASGWFSVSRGGDDDLACDGDGSIATIPDECMDDGGRNGVGDALEIYCVNGITRFCLSGESCKWRSGAPAHDDGTTCSRAGLGTATPESDQYGLDFMAHATCSEYQQHEWYYCDADAQMHFADDGVR
ncbi:MAG TPA: hypothetical protein VL463_11765 [Kofleriaceae bacterium]|nr:hypothetical protein [Kofleriaceae bacterium]